MLGTLALIRPVTTLTDGRCVGQHEVDAHRARLLASLTTGSSTLRPSFSIRSASSSITTTTYSIGWRSYFSALAL